MYFVDSEALVPVNVFVGDLAVLELHHDDNKELDGFVCRRHPGSIREHCR